MNMSFLHSHGLFPTHYPHRVYHYRDSTGVVRVGGPGGPGEVRVDFLTRTTCNILTNKMFSNGGPGGPGQPLKRSFVGRNFPRI